MTEQPNSQPEGFDMLDELRARLRAAYGDEQAIDDVDEQVERVLQEVARARVARERLDRR